MKLDIKQIQEPPDGPANPALIPNPEPDPDQGPQPETPPAEEPDSDSPPLPPEVNPELLSIQH